MPLKALKFELPCIPPTATHHSKNVVTIRGRGRLADSPGLRKAIQTLDTLLMPHRPEAPLEGPVRLTIEFHWPFLKSTPKRDQARPWLRKVTRPDCSNLAKTIEDRMARYRFIKDDAAVSDLIVLKRHSAKPGITVTLEEMPLW